LKFIFAMPILLAGISYAPVVMAVDAAPASKQTEVLQRISVQGTALQMGMGIADFPPNAEKPRHKAIGPELAYVLEGELIVLIEGEPPIVLHAGGSYQLAPNVIHITKAGPAGAKVLATWVTMPGKQFNIAVPR